jgi:hypothetical protein
MGAMPEAIFQKTYGYIGSLDEFGSDVATFVLIIDGIKQSHHSVQYFNHKWNL